MARYKFTTHHGVMHGECPSRDHAHALARKLAASTGHDVHCDPVATPKRRRKAKRAAAAAPKPRKRKAAKRAVARKRPSKKRATKRAAAPKRRVRRTARRRK